jgi:epsilon-lactone hydrolase
MASPEFKQFYQTLKAQASMPRMTIEEVRAYFEKLMSPYRAPHGITLTSVTFKRCKGGWIKPTKIHSKKILLFFHGGGYIAGSWESHQDMLGRIALDGGVSICAVNYRLAPEHPFPAALNDVLHAYEALLEQGYLPSQIIVAGSSAGGGLALALMFKLKQQKMELPCAGILICPWVDLALKGETLKTHDGQDLISRSRVTAAAQAYIGNANPQNPLISPLYGDFSGLPPLLVQAGSIEILWSEIEILVQKAQGAGVAVTFEPFQGMFHTWQLFAAQIPEGREAIHSIGKYIKTLSI